VLNLVKASAIVGAWAVAFWAPLNLFLFASSYRWNNKFIHLVSPLVVYALAASLFAVSYPLMNKLENAPKKAGILTGVLTFVLYELWFQHNLNLLYWSHGPWPYRLFPVIGGFACFGWVAVLGGNFAGESAVRYTMRSNKSYMDSFRK
jgi:hypothetical protein